MGKQVGKRLTRRERNTLDLLKSREMEQNKSVADSGYRIKTGASKYRLNKYQPTEKQQLIVNSIHDNLATVVQGSAGVGKTSIAVMTALRLLHNTGNSFNHVMFIKNPTESGDDAIGFLTGGKDDKLEAHFDTMRGIFLDFMDKAVLDSDEKNGNISFEIPNFLQGRTIKNTVMIIDESQNMSPSTVKMIMERAGEGTIIIVLGDKAQTYAVNKRKDGFTDFVERVTSVDLQGVRTSKNSMFGYIELGNQENKRSELSKEITMLYAQ